MKKLFYILIAWTGIFIIDSPTFGETLSTSDLREAIIPSTGYKNLSSAESGEGLVDYVLAFVRDSIFSLMALIAIAVFIYIGARLVVARGNQEEFTKALKNFIYAVVGILFVAFAWAIINFVVGLDF